VKSLKFFSCKEKYGNYCNTNILFWFFTLLLNINLTSSKKNTHFHILFLCRITAIILLAIFPLLYILPHHMTLLTCNVFRELLAELPMTHMSSIEVPHMHTLCSTEHTSNTQVLALYDTQQLDKSIVLQCR